MQRYAPYLAIISGQSAAMAELVRAWVAIPSGSHDIAGLAAMAAELKTAFASLGGDGEELALPPQTVIDSLGRRSSLPLGRALRFRKRPQAPLQVFLGIHYDVVYGEGPGVTPKVPSIPHEDGELHASGAADAKGGLVILLKALEAFEASPFCGGVGWEVLLNPDEELGSPGSQPLLREAAGRNHLGLLFEPSLPDGNLVGARKGSGNFAAVMRGRAAHAGRDPHLGRNAIHALAEFITALEAFGKTRSGLHVNVGRVEGGGALNRVPDLAIARFNLRAGDAEDMAAAAAFLRGQAEAFAAREGYALEVHGDFASPPKPLAGGTAALLEKVADCGRLLGMDLSWRPSGGVSDGNKLAAAGPGGNGGGGQPGGGEQPSGSGQPRQGG
jgi:glutamate carboxypeptidase